MKGFVAAVIVFALLIAGTAAYTVYWEKEIDVLFKQTAECAGEVSTQKALLISKSIALFEDKKLLLHATLKKSRIEAVLCTLDSARCYCLAGDETEMNRCITEVLNELADWREAERPTIGNIL